MAIEGKFRRHAVEVKLHLKVFFVNVGLLLFQILNNCTRVIFIDKQGTKDHLSTETFTNKAQVCRNIQDPIQYVYTVGADRRMSQTESFYWF